MHNWILFIWNCMSTSYYWNSCYLSSCFNNSFR